jgi:hypothetical protein
MKVAFHRFEPYRINDMAGGAAGFIVSMPGGVFVSRNGATGKSALTPSEKNILELIAIADSDAHQQALNV